MSTTTSPLGSDLHVFVHVVRTASFTAAGERMGVPKSTISRRIARLEDRLGVRLFQRNSRSVSVTEEGSWLYERVVDAIDTLEAAEAELTELSIIPRGRLRVSAPVTLGHLFLGPVAAAFACNYPDIELQLDLSDRFVDLVGERYDVALRAGTLRDADLVARRIGRAGLAVVASPTYLTARGTPVTPDDLRDHDGLVNDHTPWRERWRFADDVAVPIRRKLASNSWDVLREAALQGLGLAQLPSFQVGRELARGELVEVLADHARSDDGLWVVFPTSDHVPLKVRAFVDHVVASFTPTPPWAP
jgi:DNA-binding transcriptional LysR family regulator